VKELLRPMWMCYLLSSAVIGLIIKVTLHWRDVKDLKKRVNQHDCVFRDINGKLDEICERTAKIEGYLEAKK